MNKRFVFLALALILGSSAVVGVVAQNAPKTEAASAASAEVF